MNKKASRILVAMICIIFLLGFLGSIMTSFSEHTLHKCTRVDCQQCTLIFSAQSFMKVISICAIIMLIYLFISIKAKKLLFLHASLKSYNPIFLKVRLNE